MRDRTTSVARPSRLSAGTGTLDLVCCSLSARRLVVLVHADTARTAGELPWAPLDASTSLAAASLALCRASLGVEPAWTAQLGAFGDGEAHPGDAPLSVAFLAIAPAGTEAPDGWEWMDASRPGVLPARHRRMVTEGIVALRDRMDTAPVAFRLLPDRFTLSQLQEVYEVLLGRRLHKASFRRALEAAALTVATDEWRSEGRGRPAQLYRYAPRRSRVKRRPVRFELLG
jgi:8-oxo-dGTP diphosphatase